MGRKTEQTFFQRGNADGQEAHEKMLNITNYQGNANQNYNEITPHTSKNVYYEKRHEITNLGEDMNKGNPCTLLVRM